MKDLIERQAAIDLWEKYHPTIAVDAMQYDAELRQLPSAQPERKKGEWIKLYRGTIAEGLHCSVCGKHGYRSDFCPNCGVDMRGEQND